MPNDEWAASKRPFNLNTVIAAGFVVFVCVCLIALGAFREIGLRDSELRAAEVETANLSRSLIQHADDSIELVDNALIGIVHFLEAEGSAGQALGRLKSILDLRKATLPRLRGLFVYAADGSWIATSETVNITGHNNSDRDYFQHHRISTSREPYIGPPVRSRSGGQWIITVSRRVDHPDGRLAAIVLATMDVSYFAQAYSAFDLGKHGTITLLSTNGTLLARAPHDENFVGHNFSGSSILRTPTQQLAGVSRFKSTLDGIERVSAYRRSARFPLIVLAARAENDILASWRKEAVERMGLVVALSLIIGGLGFLLVRKLAERQRMLRVIEAKEADFRLLAEASSDMVSRISFDGRLSYVSPSATRITGWSADELRGTDALAGVHAIDRPQVDAVVNALRRGEMTEALVAYRTRNRTRGEVWLESALTATRDVRTGDIDGVVAISRDMTQHKELEERLAQLASRDGLTGLANRRHFDERLSAERERAPRSKSSLSLLLIDVDHFKSYNDSYGHQAGDECLKRVAATIEALAPRSSDLAARYGGEEFALLLPDTDVIGCRTIAERVRAGIAALEIPHKASSTGSVLTVSIGGACIDAFDHSTPASALIRSADTALYAAKGLGRNTVCMSAAIRHLFTGSDLRASSA